MTMWRLLLSLVISPFVIFANNYTWHASPWGPCLGGECGWNGWQVRNVFCFAESQWAVAESFCSKSDKPANKQFCFKMCAEMRRDLHWKHSKWSACKPLGLSKHQSSNTTQINCAGLQRGTQQRQVKCVWKNSRRKLDPTACPPPIPPSIRSCLLPCPQDCVVTEFQDWLTTCDSCSDSQRFRTRSVVVAPKYGGRKCPSMTESQICPQKPECLQLLLSPQNRSFSVNHLKLEVSQWGACEANTERKVRNNKDQIDEVSLRIDSHFGKRRRKLKCLSVAGDPLDLKMCLGDSLDSQMILEESCLLPRPCVLSPWSDWSITSESCVYDNQTLRLGKRYRLREVLQMPMGGGKSCPPAEDLVEETQLSAAGQHSLQLCSKFAWYAGDWSACQRFSTEDSVEEDDTCGTGIKSRVVLCAIAQSKPPKPMPDDYCRMHEKPKEIEPCPLACRLNYCHTTQWNEWSDCRAKVPDSDQGIRVRSRSLISATRPDLCPSLDQFQYCNVKPRCTELNTTKCVPSKPEEHCGKGLKTHFLSCEKMGKISMMAEAESCHLPCSNDCVLSEWSEWSQCSESCEVGSGKQSRFRLILSQNPDGLSCDKLGPLLESRKCIGSPSCDTYTIFTGKWTSCKNGIKSRLLHCLKNYLEDVDLTHCQYLNDSTLPITTKNCSETTEVCLMSDYTNWIAEESDCSTEARHKLALSINDNCKSVKETRRSESVVNCTVPKMSWLTHEWSDCISHKYCGKGVAYRDILCASARGFLPLTLCLSQLDQIPPRSTQLCTVDCDTGCFLSEWSEWSTCTQCRENPVKKRSKELIGSSKSREICAKLKLDESEGCECPEYKIEAVSDWTPCILTSHNLCGEGLRYRNIKCSTADNTVVSSELCGIYAGIENSTCAVDCPSECIWSPWSDCSLKCGIGTRHRRQIDRLIGPSPNCDYEAEEENCYNDCSLYKWELTAMESCRTEELKLCGVGRRRVEQRCYDPSSLATLSDGLCDQLFLPVRNFTCYVPCAGECVLSEWSLWEPCNCLSSSSKRYRTVLRPSESGFTSCDQFPLEETQDCTEICGPTHWELSEWSNCQSVAMSHYHLCPYNLTGLRTRKELCVRDLDGRVMDPSNCLKRNFAPQPLEEVCCIFPDVNCVVSQWLSWSSTCNSCDKGVRERQRQILQTNVGSGTRCPPLREVSVCPYRPCTTWKADKWQRCDTQGADCGYGVRLRNVTCVTVAGETADPSLCAHIPKPKTHSACLISCLTSCMYTDWSEWSRCHRQCDDSQISHSYQSRSRVLITRPQATQQCSELQLETQNCPADPSCLSFGWRNRNGTRVCERSDGLVVVGGCIEGATDCPNGCTLSNSVCYDGICICPDGFQPIYSSGNGDLKTCESPQPPYQQQQLLDDRLRVDSEVTEFDSPLLEEKIIPPRSHWLFASITAVVALCAVVFVSTWIWYNKRLARVSLT